MSYYTVTFLLGAHRFGVPFPKRKTFSEIFWALHIGYNQYKKMILGIFVYLFIYKVAMTKENFCFYKQCSQATSRFIWEQAIFEINC